MSTTPVLRITQEPESDAVLSEHPFALLAGMLLDQQFPMERAFAGPWKVLERFGSIDPKAIAEADPATFEALCTTPPAIHRYGRAMAARLQTLARIVVDEYDGDASRIWTEASSGADLVKRIEALPGFGAQKAKIFAALVGKQLGCKPRGWATAVGDYGKSGFRSVADVVDGESLAKVRAYKKEMKAKAKAASA
ncbi:Fe-S cluster assembly protein HesB [Tsukamurella sp. 8F]|uniref:HhH-GPD-type base excision DNA repair protein n=1 Tax=unclassified Tsukamurella TaxID=2633480 RepID=UPI0023B9C0DF|nr:MULTISPECIES: HhH-GPD-type base excision DNA repair protein [unclassified Tsukamurella]MDF0528796.1 Fe-S cluster assembly protein HesB [Tsukamurella sp. 8J]MDF0586631.1 Fe-S cluster assembly protein HesB [Tsukamurella sp. 8F]